MARSLAYRTFQLRAAPLRVPADEGAELGDPGARRDELDDGAEQPVVDEVQAEGLVEARLGG